MKILAKHDGLDSGSTKGSLILILLKIIVKKKKKGFG